MNLFLRKLLLIWLFVFPIQTYSAAPSLPDFTQYKDVKEKKKAFFQWMLPKIEKANQDILQERAFIESSTPKKPLSAKWQALVEKYRIDPKNKSPQQIKSLLLRRVDIIPPSLALAQAANESSWGTSRFAKKAFNFYGQWCFTQGCGLVPSQRSAGLKHEVRKFENPTASVKSYMRNLNSHPSFKALRDIRLSLRKSNKPLEGKALSAGLLSYSERKQDYVKELNAMIRVNKLSKYDLKP